MEALGAAASVLTIIEVAKEVYFSCQKYILGVMHARKEIQHLSAEVLALSDVLERVDELLNSPSASKLPTLRLLQKPDGAFQQCENQLREILSKLGPAEGWVDLVERSSILTYVSEVPCNRNCHILRFSCELVDFLGFKYCMKLCSLYFPSDTIKFWDRRL